MTLLFVDIETIPAQKPEIRERIAANVKPPAAMKKADTIAAWEKEQRPAAVDEAVAKSGLNGAYGSICCIGWAFDNEPVQTLLWPLTVNSEAALLHTFKDMIATNRVPTIVGHNVAKFDIRFIWQRAMVLGIRMPGWFPRNPRPWGSEVFDTMTAWAGDREYISMNELSFALGLEGKGDIDGSMVAELWANGEFETIANYCASDVERTRAIYRKMQIAMGEAA